MTPVRVLAVGWGVLFATRVVHLRAVPVPRARALLPEHRLARHFGVARSAPRRVEISRRAVLVVGAVALVAALVFPPAGLAVVATALARPAMAGRRAKRAVAVAVEANVADVVTLIGLAVGAGHNLLGALGAASAQGGGPVATALAVTVGRVERGERLADALEALPARLGESVRPMVSALVSCDRYGAPLGPTLDRLAADVRVSSRQRAEAAARRLPVRLLFPLISCILPAFALLTVAPLIAGSLRGLRL